MYETIKLSIHEQVALLVLNRPESLNSINKKMLEEIKKALKEIKKSSSRVLLITGSGKGFCSGQDLSERSISPNSPSVDLGESLEKTYNPIMKLLYNLPIPIVSAVNGVAAGAGVSLALIADIMLMSSSASLVLAFSKIGLVPDSGCTWLLVNSIGFKRAKILSMLGGRISSQKASEWGLAWEVYEDDEIFSQANKLASKIRDMPTKGLDYIKRCFNEVPHNNFIKQLEVEKDFQRLAGRTFDYREGVDAFLTKRKPIFKGK